MKMEKFFLWKLFNSEMRMKKKLKLKRKKKTKKLYHIESMKRRERRNMEIKEKMMKRKKKICKVNLKDASMHKTNIKTYFGMH